MLRKDDKLLNRLDLQKIIAHCKGDYHIELLEETDSTNRRLRQAAEGGAPEGTVIFALHQTAGKGRMGRSFFSPAGSGLYFSILLRPQAMADGMKITAAAGVAVAEAVKEILGIELAIKWVNDLYLGNKKVCGILAESAMDADGNFNYCVVGIGLNVFEPQCWEDALDQIAGALLPQARENVMEPLAAAILDRFFDWYQKLSDPRLMEAYRSRSFLQGKRVTAVRGNERIKGVVQGISDEGELLLQTESGEVLTICSGEVRLEDYR